MWLAFRFAIAMNPLGQPKEKSPEFLPGSLRLVPSPRYVPNFFYCAIA